MTDTTYTAIGNRQKVLMDIGTDIYAEVIALPSLAPTTWIPTTVLSARVYADVEIQIIGTPTTPYIFQDSFDGTTFNDCAVWDKAGLPVTSAAVAGRFRLPGNCFLRARQGAGSTVYIRAGS
jgi:hypothetical protein